MAKRAKDVVAPAAEDTNGRSKSKPPRRRKQEILDAAARVFHERGYESTSIQDIADAVGILKGSLYYYIESKEDLLYEILHDVHAEALQNMTAVDEIEADALTKIRAFVTFHVTFNAEHLVGMGVFFQDFRSLSDERREEIVEERDLYDKFVRKLIREGQQEKLICPDIDAKLAAFGILGMMNWIYQWFKPAGPSAARKVAEEFADFVVAGLACDPKTHSPGHRRQVGQL
jgi:TetR/AcrR family transcriptional regulator, cholesterol catabolism regulator